MNIEVSENKNWYIYLGDTRRRFNFLGFSLVFYSYLAQTLPSVQIVQN